MARSIVLTALGELLADAWKYGPPVEQERTATIDTNIGHVMKCGGCHHTGMTFLPFHRDDEYNGVFECPNCGWQEGA
jgi:hypothetical protein